MVAWVARPEPMTTRSAFVISTDLDGQLGPGRALSGLSLQNNAPIKLMNTPPFFDYERWLSQKNPLGVLHVSLVTENHAGQTMHWITRQTSIRVRMRAKMARLVVLAYAYRVEPFGEVTTTTTCYAISVEAHWSGT